MLGTRCRIERNAITDKVRGTRSNQQNPVSPCLHLYMWMKKNSYCPRSPFFGPTELIANTSYSLQAGGIKTESKISLSGNAKTKFCLVEM